MKKTDKVLILGSIALDTIETKYGKVENLLGDPTKAKEKLGWEPKITLEEMVHEMMENDIKISRNAPRALRRAK